MLKQRIITALVLSALILTALFYLPHLWFVIGLAGITALAAWEWANLSAIEKMPLRILYAVICILLVFLGVQYVGLDYSSTAMTRLRDIAGIGCVWWAIALLWVMMYPGSAPLWGSVPARLLMGLFVLVPSTLALVFISGMESGQWMFVYVVGIVIAADVGAYFAGRAWGKRKLAPLVSPGKSWAGFWGGLASTMALALIVGSFVTVASLSFPALLAVTLVTTLASVLGDLLESMVKRHRGIKDSSQILPGHGGVMDRIDSLSAAAPVFTLLMLLLQGY